jgi:hypothetical protein
MLKSGSFWLAISGVALIALYQILAAGYLSVPFTGIGRQFLITEVGIAGLALIATAVLVWLVNKTHKRTREWPSKILARGAAFGMVSGALVAVMFQAPVTPEDIAVGSDGIIWFYRLQRILGFAALMGGGIYLILHLIAYSTSGHLVSRPEQILAMSVGFSAVVVCGLWGAMELPRVGGALCQISFGVIDWVGAGVGTHGKCDAASLQARALRPRADIPQISAAMLGFYFLFVAIYENGKWRLSFARSIMVIGGAVVAGFTLYEIVAALNADTGSGQPKSRFVQDGALRGVVLVLDDMVAAPVFRRGAVRCVRLHRRVPQHGRNADPAEFRSAAAGHVAVLGCAQHSGSGGGQWVDRRAAGERAAVAARSSPTRARR